MAVPRLRGADGLASGPWPSRHRTLSERAQPLHRGGGRALARLRAHPGRAACATRRARSCRPRSPRSIAWLLATEVVGHTTPFFAPVSAIITLGLTQGERGRRAVEVVLGVTLGIAVADLLVIAARHRAGGSSRVVDRALDDGGAAARLGPAVRPAGRGLGRARGHAAAARRRGHLRALPRRADRRRRRAGRQRARPARPPRPDGPRGGRPGAGGARRRCSTTSRRRSGRATASAVEAALVRGRGDRRARRASSRTPSSSAARPRGCAPPRRRTLGTVDDYADAAAPDRPRRPQRPRARARRAAGDRPRRERPARGVRRAARARRRGPCARAARSRTRAAPRPSARPRSRAAGQRDAGARADRQPVGVGDRRPGPLDRRRPAARAPACPTRRPRTPCGPRCRRPRRRRRSAGSVNGGH